MAEERYQRGFKEGESELVAKSADEFEIEIEIVGEDVVPATRKSRRLDIPPLRMGDLDKQRGIGDRF